MSQLPNLDPISYEVKNADALLTPCLLVYPDKIEANLKEAIRIAGGPEYLRPHVKTHKSPAIVKMQLEHGITKHKCATLREAAMLAECGVPDVLLAYPLIGPAAKGFCEQQTRFPGTNFSAIADSLQGLEMLSEAAACCGTPVSVHIDIDCGMHRTGIAAKDAGLVAMLDFLRKNSNLRFAGLHVYDGHNHQADLGERQESVNELLAPVLKLMDECETAGIELERVVCGGTPTFGVFAEVRASWKRKCHFELSPGTCVLSDYNYLTDYADLSGFRPAAFLLTRVISKTGPGLLTLDLGNKAVAADPPAGSRCHFPTLSDAKELKHNEEHLVIETSQADAFAIGDTLLALPAHICPTVALHREMQVIRDGMPTEAWEVLGRDRIYRLDEYTCL